MSMPRTPKDLFLDQLRDLHSVEMQLVEALPALAARAVHTSLHETVAGHAAQTVCHLNLLTAMLKKLGAEPGDGKCKAMEGLISGGDVHLDSVDDEGTRDLMIIAHGSRIEHYEMAGYGIALRLATRLDLKEEALILESILIDEREAAQGLESLEPALFERAQDVL